MEQPITTSWVWQHENGTQAASLHLEKCLVLWYDNPDCGCGDNAHEQTFEQFLNQGARWADPPKDVEAEIRAAVENIPHS